MLIFIKQKNPNIYFRGENGQSMGGTIEEYLDIHGKHVEIRRDSQGHFYGPNNPQNRRPHYNDKDGGHYDF
jgi:filamentous hemagglutinin